MRGKTVRPLQLPADYHWLQTAVELIALYQQHVGRSRGALNDAVKAYEGDRLDYPVIRGLAAVLDGMTACDSQPAVDPAALREALFAQGPALGGRDGLQRERLVAETAARYAVTPAQVESALFADLAEEQIITAVPTDVTPAALIGRYNLEVARGLLYWAKEMRLTVSDGYKDLFKFIKLFKLMYTVQAVSRQPSAVSRQHSPAPSPQPLIPDPQSPIPAYHITLHGPISPFVSATMRYGLQFAKFLPALLLCRRWEMAAEVRPPGARGWLRYTLDEQTPLRSHFRASGEFDSRLEADFAAEFEQKYTRAEREWALSREDELIVVGDTVMIPDFALTNRKNGRRALIEIVGYWHPNYLRRKLEKVRQAQRTDLILLVYESANVSAEPFAAEAAGEVLAFTRKPVLKEVLAAAERAAIPQK